MRKIMIDESTFINHGAEGDIYRLDEERILKVYKKASLELVRQWFHVINSAIEYGVASARPHEIVEVDNRYGIIFDYLDAENVGQTIAAAPGRLDEYGERMGNFLKKLHSTEDTFDLVENYDEKMFAWYDESCKRNIFSDKVAEKMKNVLTSIPKRITLIHGDFHPGNVVVKNGKLVCIDLDRVGSGHPIFDLMGIHFNHNVAAKHANGLFKTSWGLKADQIFALKSRMMKTYYGIDSDKKLKEYEGIVEQAFLVRRMLFPVTPTFNLDDEKAKAFIADAIPNFFKVADELPDMIKSLPI